MSLRAKIVLILSAIVLLYAGLDHVIQRVVVVRSFAALEEAEAEKDLLRVVEAFEGELEAVDARCLDWSVREDTLRYARAPFAGYEQNYLSFESLRDNDLDALFVLDPEGIALWSRVVDLATGQDIDLRSNLPRGGLRRGSHPLLPRTDDPPTKPLAGLFATERGPLLTSTRPILSEGHAGELLGYLLMGRFVDEPLLDSIRERTSVAFTIDADPTRAEEGPERERWDRVAGAPIDPATQRPAVVLEQAGEEELLAFAALEDVRLSPNVLVRAEIPRDITAKGRTAALYALLSTVAAGLLIMLVLLFVLQRTVLTPIERLTRTAVHIGRSEDFSVRTGSQRKDEVGILSREFDDMVVKLDASRKALVETARAAGMSEIATGVLHNVGNVLNSVNVSASLIGEKVRSLRTQDLTRALKVVADHGGDLLRFCAEHPKGGAFYPLLRTLTEQIAKEREALLAEIGAMSEGLEHVKELVKAQQGYAALGSGVQEQVELPRVVESAYGFCSRAVEEVKGLAVVRDYAALPQVKLDRHRAIEILVNVIQNALQSLRDARADEPRIALSIHAVGGDGEGRVRFQVTDNGVGIAPENLTRIFAHGFTTKRDGHGFGLHAAANAATEMGGTLTVHSDGPGRGATFTLEVPVQAIPVMAEAA